MYIQPNTVTKHLLVLLVSFTLQLQIAKAQCLRYSYVNSVYQYAVSVGSRQAYLWVPPKCKQVRGIIISFSNLLERNWLEDPIIRNEAAKDDLGVILVEASPEGLTAEMKTPEALLKLLKDMATESGYAEIENAPLIPIDHSVYGSFTWNLPNWFPERTIAAIPVKTFPLPKSVKFEGVPICYIVGETDEWPPIKDGRLWNRDFIWPIIRRSAIELRSANSNNLIGVVTDPGGGHLDWSDRLSKLMALYIHKACQYRLPKKPSLNGLVKLNKIEPAFGWLVDTGGLYPDRFSPAPYQKYKGDPKKAYWFFDKETAYAAMAFCGNRIKRKKQMLTFVQDGKQLPISKQGFVNLKFLPEQDGISFKIQGGFLPMTPPELIGAGDSLGHANGIIKFRVITGPAIQTGPDQFKIEFNRSSPGDVWIQEGQAGNATYKHAVQPGQIKIPIKLTEGKPQTITFPKIADQHLGVKQINLSATSNSGLPVEYYVVCGPAIVNGNTLKFTDIPVKSHYPIKITLTAYQWGRMLEPLYQSAEPVTQSFLMKMNPTDFRNSLRP